MLACGDHSVPPWRMLLQSMVQSEKLIILRAQPQRGGAPLCPTRGERTGRPGGPFDPQILQ